MTQPKEQLHFHLVEKYYPSYNLEVLELEMHLLEWQTVPGCCGELCVHDCYKSAQV